jgi:hypothetical protein
MDTSKLAIGLSSCRYLYGKCLWSSEPVQVFFSGAKMVNKTGKD